jgi:hypothetical protein
MPGIRAMPTRLMETTTATIPTTIGPAAVRETVTSTTPTVRPASVSFERRLMPRWASHSRTTRPTTGVVKSAVWSVRDDRARK